MCRTTQVFGQRRITIAELLSRVLEAHGGLNNWSKVTKVTPQLSLGGPFWGGRGWPDVYEGQTVTLDPHREHITFTPFTGPGRTSVLDVAPGTERVEMRSDDGLEGGTIPEDRSRSSPIRSNGTRCKLPISRAPRREITSPLPSCSPIPASRRTKSIRGARMARPGDGWP